MQKWRKSIKNLGRKSPYFELLPSRKELILINSTWFRDLAGALIFYTVLPGFPFIKPRFERIARFAPLIGIVIGFIQGSIWLILSDLDWPKESIALFVVASGIVLTGGLHLDGLMDTSDGLSAGKIRCLEAMKDSRVGSIGVQSLIIILLIQISALIKLEKYAPTAIIMANFWGRCAPLLAINQFKYLHQGRYSDLHRAHWKGWHELKPAFLTIIAIIAIFSFIKTSLISPWKLILIGIFPTIIIPKKLGKWLGGHSGDSYGASIVLVETITLILLALFWN